MKIYILSYQHNEDGNVVSYHGSKRAAMRTFLSDKKIAAENGHDADDPIIWRKEVPKTKKGVLHFLNTQTPAHDNG